ncbi:MAG: class I SAM-dependent methyltransferase, partial [Rubripirellula sp.]
MTDSKTDDYRHSHLGADKAKSYNNLFQDNPYRKILWQFERQVVDRVIAELGQRPLRHLDFACGTGRVVAHVESHDHLHSTGVDISPDMLNEARKHVGHSTLVEADLTRDDVLAEKRFDLITAFRFFPNAQGELR